MIVTPSITIPRSHGSRFAGNDTAWFYGAAVTPGWPRESDVSISADHIESSVVLVPRECGDFLRTRHRSIRSFDGIGCMESLH
jgi:hypothetical protein